MELVFLYVDDLCNSRTLKQPNIQACADGSKDFTITRAQMFANIGVSKERGAYIKSEEHNQKCLELLECSKKSDLVLFPEYCFSYESLKQIVNNEALWPTRYKLWCLPCQGIAHDTFFKKLDEFERCGAVVFRDGVKTPAQCGDFVNALFYCFVTTEASSPSEQKLVLLPQLKTQHMADQEDKCESYMTLGDTIFVFGEPGGNCLVSLLCADVLNPDLTWRDLKRKGSSFILLHPQLNKKPAHPDFKMLRDSIFRGTTRNVYISANWAKGTLGISNPWSCLYFKHEVGNDFHKWREAHTDLLQENSMHLLYGGYYCEKRVSIWYAWVSEFAQSLKIQKPFCGMAVQRGKHDVIALQCLYWENVHGWREVPEGSEREYRRKHNEECLEENSEDYKKLLIEICKNHKLHYPFVIAEKAQADRFWELLQAKAENSYITLRENEIPQSPVILFEEENIKYMCSALGNIRDLQGILDKKELPKYLEAFHNGYCFGLCSGTDQPYNITAKNGEMHIVLAITEDKLMAEHFINELKKDAFKDFDNIESELPYLVCVVAKDIVTRERRFYPEFNPSITAAERGTLRGDITEGGNE